MVRYLNYYYLSPIFSICVPKKFLTVTNNPNGLLLLYKYIHISFSVLIYLFVLTLSLSSFLFTSCQSMTVNLLSHIDYVLYIIHYCLLSLLTKFVTAFIIIHYVCYIRLLQAYFQKIIKLQFM